ncbi:MAG: hypothetical protein AAFO07_03640, partial [Bacteroidota bacterium]
MEPLFTNDAIVFGLLILTLAFVFKTSSSANPAFKKFYTYVPPLLLCYFLPALLHWPLGFIAQEWYDNDLIEWLAERGYQLDPSYTFAEVNAFLAENGIASSEVASFSQPLNQVIIIPLLCY